LARGETGFGASASGALRPHLDSRPADPPASDQSHAGVCRPTRLADRRRDQGSRLRRSAAAKAGGTARRRPPPRSGRNPRLAARPLGPIPSRPHHHPKRARGAGHRLCLAYRSLRHDDPDRPRPCRNAGRLRGVRARDSQGTCESRHRPGTRQGNHLRQTKSAAKKTAEIKRLYRKEKLSQSEIARRLGIGRTSVRRLLESG